MYYCVFFKTVKNTIFTKNLGTPASVFIEACREKPLWLINMNPLIVSDLYYANVHSLLSGFIPDEILLLVVSFAVTFFQKYFPFACAISMM